MAEKEESDSTQLWSKLPQKVFPCGMPQVSRANYAVSEDLAFFILEPERQKKAKTKLVGGSSNTQILRVCSI